jgi:hypothetical protein
LSLIDFIDPSAGFQEAWDFVDQKLQQSSESPFENSPDEPLISGLDFDRPHHSDHAFMYDETHGHLSDCHRLSHDISSKSFHDLEDTTTGSCSSTDSPSLLDEQRGLSFPDHMLQRARTKPPKSPFETVEERSGHNALERERRINIRLCFENLHNSIPGMPCRTPGVPLTHLELRGKRAHSLQILQEGAKYIRMLTIQDIEIQRAKAELLKQNQELKAKLAMLSHRSYK